jgi:hypothetical protein
VTPTVTITDDDGRQIRLTVYRGGATLAEVELTAAFFLAGRLTATRFLQDVERREVNG